MNTKNIIGITAFAFITGIIVFLYFQGWIILQSPFANKCTTLTHISPTTKKKAKLVFWRNNNWCTEEAELIWSQNNDENILYLLNNLLSLMLDEEVLNKKISVESVMTSPTGQEALISFERNPLRKEAATFEKWMIIESIINTIRDNEIPVQSVRFLVHHKPLEDYHLDFSKGWSI